MNSRRIVCAVAGLAMAAGAGAAPVVSDVTLTQASPNRLYIDYKLSEPAVVTFDVLTNGVSIGRELLENFTGDCRKVVKTESGRIAWKGITHVWPDVVVPNKGMTAVVTAWATNAPPDYMIVDLANTNVSWYVKEEDIPGGTVLRDEYKTTKLVMRRIHAKGETFRCGVQQGEPVAGYSSTQTPHLVTLTEDFYIGVFELTQGQWLAVRPQDDTSTRFSHRGDKLPVDSTGYTGIRGSSTVYHFVTNRYEVAPGGFLGLLRAIANGIRFDLPTSAQWQFAARAGTQTFYNNGSNFTTGADDVAWHSGNWAQDTSLTANNTHEVGLLKPNAWGLYDCHGNVWEVCGDRYQSNSTIPFVDCTDPLGPITESRSFRCGGAYAHSSDYSRSAMRIEQNMENGDYRNGYRLFAPCEAK